VKLALAILIPVLLLAAGFLYVRLGADDDPDALPPTNGGAPDVPGGTPEVAPATGTGPSGAEPRPSVSDLIEAEGEAAAEGLAALLADPATRKELVAALVAVREPARRAELLLRILRTDATDAPGFVRGAATGRHGAELRVPGILALAGGDAESIALLAGIARDDRDPDLARAALVALALSATADGQTVVGELLEACGDADARRTLYEALCGGAPGVTLGEGYLDELRAERGRIGLHPDERFPGPYHRIVTAVSSERDPAAMPTAARVLVNLEEPAARDGLVSLFERSEAEVRGEVFEAVVAGLPAREGATLARMARAAPDEEATELRRRSLDHLRGTNGRDLESALRDWEKVEKDPTIREGLAEEIRRLEHAPGEEGR
jgi:hypothetical protein